MVDVRQEDVQRAAEQVGDLREGQEAVAEEAAKAHVGVEEAGHDDGQNDEVPEAGQDLGHEHVGRRVVQREVLEE